MYAQPLPDNAERARWASALLLINICLFGIMFLRDILKMVASSAYYTNYGIVLLAEGWLEIACSLLMIVTAVFFIMWFRRAYNNLHIAGARSLPYSEGWAAGGWFVPILHWFYPHRIMNAIWRETPVTLRKMGEHYEPAKEGIVGAWWTLWILGNILSTIQSQLILRGEVSPADISITVIDFLSDGSLIAAAWLGIRMIKAVSEMEADLQRRYNEWLAHQTQLHAQQFYQQTVSRSPQAMPPQQGSGPQQ